jgi:hypothetical protein
VLTGVPDVAGLGAQEVLEQDLAGCLGVDDADIGLATDETPDQWVVDVFGISGPPSLPLVWT